jgi:murein DD-endopeptidase MepM/ murein hydrolase activator NlpD
MRPRRNGALPLLAAWGIVLAACGPRPIQLAEATPVSTALETPSHEATSVIAWATPDNEQPASSTPPPLVQEGDGSYPVSAWRPPPYPVPLAIRPEDHFYFSRPIPSGNVNWPHPKYRYGNTFFGEESVHTGVDLGADGGTPVLAAGDGEVVWAGYGLYRGVYDETDPYGIAVAIRHDFGYNGQTLYTVYGHLAQTDVWPGQRVSRGEKLGTVGNTGHASGKHLHFEVRLAQNRYFESRNPELWMVPPEGWGVLAGKILDSYGRPMPEYMLTIRSLESDRQWEVWTYAKETVHPDDVFGENFVISDLPSGSYEVEVDFVGHAFITQIALLPGQTNLISFRGRRGFQPVALPTPSAPGPLPPFGY